MPQAKKPAARAKRPSAPSGARAATKEPAALRRLSKSLDSAHAALGELRTHTSRDVSKGAKDLYNDLRGFLSNARRDTAKLASALRRDLAATARAKPARGSSSASGGRTTRTASRTASATSRSRGTSRTAARSTSSAAAKAGAAKSSARSARKPAGGARRATSGRARTSASR